MLDHSMRRTRRLIVVALVLLPVHVMVCLYAFNMNTIAWAETGRMLGGGNGADPDLMNRAVHVGYQFYKGTFALFGLEFLLLLAAVLKWGSRSSGHRNLEYDVDHEHAWSISARLAAVSELDEAALPNDVACLLREARDLHPAMKGER